MVSQLVTAMTQIGKLVSQNSKQTHTHTHTHIAHTHTGRQTPIHAKQMQKYFTQTEVFHGKNPAKQNQIIHKVYEYSMELSQANISDKKNKLSGREVCV